MRRQDIEEFKVKSAIKRAVRDVDGNTYLHGYLVKDSPYLDNETVLLTDREFNDDYCRFSMHFNLTASNILIFLEERVLKHAKPNQIIIVPIGVEKMLEVASMRYASLLNNL